MANLKVTYIFKAGTQGWTETFYIQGTDVGSVGAQANNLAAQRCRMLAQGALLQAYRVTDADLVGTSFFSPVSAAFSFARYPRNPANSELLPRDTIQVSAVCRLNSADFTYHRIFELGSLPDGWVIWDATADAMIPTPDLFNPFNAFLAQLNGDSWQMRVISRQPANVNARPVQGVALLGQVVTITSVGHTYSVGDVVRINKVVGSAAMKAVVKGTHQITGITANTFTYNVTTAPVDPVVWTRNGVIRRQVIAYVAIRDGVILRMNIRERGRAFFTQRGRRRVAKVV